MDVSCIPKKYGGDLDFECGMMPSLDPEIRRCLEFPNPELEELFVTGPTRWVDSAEGDMVALSVGSIDGKSHKEAVATMHSWAVRTATGSSNFQRMHSDYFQSMDADYPTNPSSYQPSSASQSRPQSKGDAQDQAQMQPPPPPPPQTPLGTQSQDLASSVEQPQAPSAVENPPLAPDIFPTGSSQPQVQPTQQMPPPPIPSSTTQTQSRSAMGVGSERAFSNGSIVKTQSVSLDGQMETQNGRAGPPKNIAMPPTQLQRAETQYMTPAAEPSELNRFQ